MDSYEDLYKTAIYYHKALYFEAILLLLNFLFVIKFLRIIPTMNFFFNVLKDSLKMFSALGGFFGLLLVGYAVIASNIWGPYFYGFKDVANSILNILLVFELSLGDSRVDLYSDFSFGHEKFFGVILIILIITTVLALMISVAVVVKAFDKQLMYFEQAKVIYKKEGHYLIRWFRASGLTRFCTRCTKNKERKDNYELSPEDRERVEEVKNIGKKFK